MNLQNNVIPEKVQSIHLIAICGTGMGALAGMLKEAGFQVTGSDHHVYPPMSTFLTELGIRIAEGYGPDNLSHRPDLVVVGNAVSKDNPEVIRMFEMGLPFCSLPQALNRFFIHMKSPLVVVGTHGKTTTTALLAWVLSMAALNPGFMAGGILKNLNRNYNVGSGPHFVVEGDEYDTAFFDKGPKFMHYTPSRAVLTSVEFDHADIYRDLNHVRKSFVDFVRAMPEDSLLLACDEVEDLKELTAEARCWVTTYGFAERSPWRLEKIAFDPPWTYLDISLRGEPFGSFKSPLMGRHNALNTLAVIALAHDLRIPKEVIADALKKVEGVRRRQEIRGITREVTVMDDFAHHPTEVQETLAAARAFYANSRLIAVFEPRTNSSMRKVFQGRYSESFDPADVICIRNPALLEKVPPEERFSSEQLVRDLVDRGKRAFYFPDTEGILTYLADTAQPEDVILIMSNGSFDNIHERLLERLR